MVARPGSVTGESATEAGASRRAMSSDDLSCGSTAPRSNSCVIVPAVRVSPSRIAPTSRPSRTDMLAGSRIIDAAVARELIGLLPVLAPALPVALAGQAAVSATHGARQTQREGQVDQRRDRVGAVAVLLCPAGSEYHRALSPREHVDRGALFSYRHAGDPLHPLR